MKLLLTSAGIRNPSIHAALVDLLGKPIAESNALCIPTASYGHPNVRPEGAWKFISGREPSTPLVELGWKSVGVLELTALPSMDQERWVSWVRETDVLLVNGGDALYLAHWMRQSGLADLLPSLTETVWVGLSAGSMVMTPRIGADFVGWKSPSGSDETLGIVDFHICPHVNGDDKSGNTMAEAESWAAGIEGPAYAVDDETAFKVVDGKVEIISQGRWRLFNPDSSSDGQFRPSTRLNQRARMTPEVSGIMRGSTRRLPMQTRPFPSTPDARSPAGAEVRHLIDGETGGMIHSTVPPGQVNRATVHATVSEFWHVLSGEGQIWRRDGTGEATTVLVTGVTIDIPVGTAFQYRCTGVDPLQFLCITMPRWPGDEEATVIEGPWKPTAPEGW